MSEKVMRITVHRALGGGYECPHCKRVNTCYNVESRVKWDVDPVKVTEIVCCEKCGKQSSVSYPITKNAPIVST